ncbi:MAG TPA: alpha/beta hydrolase [Rhizomicrobium sp.]|nr:alpha/beta hydrolase [Rhizomicrobium sp.]
MTKDKTSNASRRALLAGGVGVAAAASVASSTAAVSAPRHAARPAADMPSKSDGFIRTSDGVKIYYKDWGSGQPIVFSHGWPLSGDDWDAQMMFFLAQGYRVIAHDRRGHGRSSQTDTGNDMDHYAADLAALTAALGLKNAIHVGHSTGGGEVVHYVARYQQRVAKAVLISAVPPLLLKTDTNPDGIPREGFDPYRQQTAYNRAQFYLDVPSGPFYNFNKPGVKTIPGLVQNWWRQGMMGGVKAQVDCVKAFSETDFRDDLRKITVPVLVMHSKDDQVVPYALSGPKSVALLKNGTLKTYADNMPHGMMTTHAEIINADLLAFFKA